MAEVKSFPNNQDVYIGAEWVMKWLHGRTSGVFGANGNLSTSVVPDSMSVEVSDGVGWLSNDKGDGIVFWNDYEQTNGNKLRLTHDTADSALDRIDRVVITWETTNYVALPTISILKGTASSSPVPPALTNNNVQRQISLRQQRIPAGATSISSSFGLDERLNPNVCGIVTETLEIDTSTMFEQFDAFINQLRDDVQGVKDNTAFVFKSGDVMTGNLSVPAPSDNGHATNKEYVDTEIEARAKKILQKFTAVIPTDGWFTWTDASGQTFGYVDIPVPGILSTDDPDFDYDASVNTSSTIIYRQRQWALTIYKVQTSNDRIRVFATSAPTEEIPIKLKAVR